MPLEGLESTVPATEWPQTYALDGAAIHVGLTWEIHKKIMLVSDKFTKILSLLNIEKNNCFYLSLEERESKSKSVG